MGTKKKTRISLWFDLESSAQDKRTYEFLKEAHSLSELDMSFGKFVKWFAVEAMMQVALNPNFRENDDEEVINTDDTPDLR